MIKHSWPFLFLAAACGDPTTGTTAQSAATQYVTENKVTVGNDCGTATYTTCGQPDAAAAAALSCLKSALSKCETARATVVLPTVEGDPITTVVVVEKVVESCRAVVFTDTTKDRFGTAAVYRQKCAEVVVNSEACPPVRAESCTDRVDY